MVVIRYDGWQCCSILKVPQIDIASLVSITVGKVVVLPLDYVAPKTEDGATGDTAVVIKEVAR